jgi:hypothetical protein
MRNYYSHKKIPPVGFEISYSEKHEKLENKFVLFLDDINTNSFPKAKNFIDNHNGNTVDILDLVEKYINKTVFPWIMQQQLELHKEDFKELDGLQKLAKNLISDK